MTFHFEPMTARYITPISIREARDFMQLNFEAARIPHGSTCFWISGVHQVTDTPGVYLISGAGGMQGVWVIPRAQSMEVAV